MVLVRMRLVSVGVFLVESSVRLGVGLVKGLFCSVV